MKDDWSTCSSQTKKFDSRKVFEALQRLEEALTATSLSRRQTLLLGYIYLVAGWRLEVLQSLEGGEAVETDILREVDRPEFDFLDDDVRKILNFWLREKGENALQQIKDRIANRIRPPLGPRSS